MPLRLCDVRELASRMANAWRMPNVDDIQSDQFATIARATPASMLGHILNTTIALVAFSQAIPSAELAAWGLLSYFIAGYVLLCALKRAPSKGLGNIRRGVRKAIIFGIALAAPWSILVCLYLGELPQHEEVLLVTLCVGMAASGSILLSPVYPAAIAYMSTILVPATIACFAIVGGTDYNLLGGLCGSFALFLLTLISSATNLFAQKVAAVQKLETSLFAVSQAREEIERIASSDGLTGLANRRSFTAFLQDLQKNGQSGNIGTKFGLFFLDLDKFKLVNDTHGHSVGDDLLVSVANRLNECVRAGDFVARLGGDEFAIITLGIAQESEAQIIADRLIKRLSEPHYIAGLQIFSGVSVGAALSQEHSYDCRSLLAFADSALFDAKSKGRGTFCIYIARTPATVDARRQVELRFGARNQAALIHPVLKSARLS